MKQFQIIDEWTFLDFGQTLLPKQIVMIFILITSPHMYISKHSVLHFYISVIFSLIPTKTFVKVC